jgi:hypothetical protein
VIVLSSLASIVFLLYHSCSYIGECMKVLYTVKMCFLVSPLIFELLNAFLDTYIDVKLW